MEYINVSQFYETVLCFALPLLIIQRMILYCTGLSAKYQQFRRNFYQAEFQITQEYKFIPEQNQDKDEDTKQNQNKPPKEESIRDSMLNESQRENIRRNSMGQIINEQDGADRNNQEKQNDHNRMSRLSSRLPEPNRTVIQSVAQRKTYADLDLQTDKQFKVDPRLSQRQKRKSVTTEEKNEEKSQSGKKDQINSSNEEEPEKEKKEKEQVVQEEQSDAKVQEKKEKEQSSEQQPVGGGSEGEEEGEQNEKQQTAKPSRKYSFVQVRGDKNVSEKSEEEPKEEQELSEIEVSKEQELQEKTSNADKMEEIQVEDRRETQLDRDNLAIENVNQQQKQPREQIEISPYEMEEKEMIERRRIKYCRRIDQAFSFYVPILFSVIVLGILTHSVYIFSMCCFFGFAFTSLLFNYGQLLQRLQDASTKESMFGKINKLLAGGFIIALFVSYWIDNQFGN